MGALQARDVRLDAGVEVAVDPAAPDHVFDVAPGFARERRFD